MNTQTNKIISILLIIPINIYRQGINKIYMIIVNGIVVTIFVLLVAMLLSHHSNNDSLDPIL